MTFDDSKVNKENPWKTLGSKSIYSNPWMSVREDRVIRPDGVNGIFGVVSMRAATAIVALTPKDEIYMVGQYRYAPEHYSWEVIQGGADEDEKPIIAAKRELAEEAGLIAEQWSQLGEEVHLSNCVSSERGFAYIARGLCNTASSPEGTEVLEVVKMPFRDALSLVEQGEVKDAMSIIAILRAERLLKS